MGAGDTATGVGVCQNKTRRTIRLIGLFNNLHWYICHTFGRLDCRDVESDMS